MEDNEIKIHKVQEEEKKLDKIEIEETKINEKTIDFDYDDKNFHIFENSKFLRRYYYE